MIFGSVIANHYDHKSVMQLPWYIAGLFNMYFLSIEMCASIGVDPLASSKGFWSEMLGFGDFYYELSVQIVEVCMAASHRTGGLMEVGELRKRLIKSRSKSKNQDISTDDIIRAIKKLKILGMWEYFKHLRSWKEDLSNYEFTLGAFTNYVDKFLAFFDHLTPCVDIFYLINVDKNKTFLDYLPTSSCKRSLWTPPNVDVK